MFKETKGVRRQSQLHKKAGVLTTGVRHIVYRVVLLLEGDWKARAYIHSRLFARSAMLRNDVSQFNLVPFETQFVKYRASAHR